MRIIPNKKRWNSWAMPTKVKYIASIATIISLLFVVLNFFFSDPTKYDSKANSGSVDVVEGDQKNNESTTIVEEDMVLGDKNSNVEHDSNHTIPEYAIFGFRNMELKRLLEKDGFIKISSDAQKVIQVLYTGDVVLLSQGNSSYIYTGGHINLIVDENCITTFPNLKIPQMRPSSKGAIVAEIQKRINIHVEDNLQDIFNKIKECLKN